jgi:hypothetical protein
MDLSNAGKTSAILAAFFTLVASSAANAEPDPQCFSPVDARDSQGRPFVRYSAKSIHVDVKWPQPLKSGSEVEFDASGSTVPSGKMESEWVDMHPDFKLISGSKTDAVKKYKVPDRDGERDFNGRFRVVDTQCGTSQIVGLTLKVIP